MKKGISSVVVGGLATGATVLGVDASLNSADAAVVNLDQVRSFSLSAVDLNPNANTATLDGEDILFNPFAQTLGRLTGVSLSFESSQTVVAGRIETVLSQVSIGGNEVARSDSPGAFRFAFSPLAPGTFTLNEFIGQPVVMGLQTNVNFDDNSVFGQFDWDGVTTLTYTYDDAQAVPTPATLALFGAGIAMLGGGMLRRPRRPEDRAST